MIKIKVNVNERQHGYFRKESLRGFSEEVIFEHRLG
jgi:hypothetical protein